MFAALKAPVRNALRFLATAYASHVFFVLITVALSLVPTFTGTRFYEHFTAAVLVCFFLSWWATDHLVTGRGDPKKNLVTGGLFAWIWLKMTKHLEAPAAQPKESPDPSYPIDAFVNWVFLLWFVLNCVYNAPPRSQWWRLPLIVLVYDFILLAIFLVAKDAYTTWLTLILARDRPVIPVAPVDDPFAQEYRRVYKAHCDHAAEPVVPWSSVSPYLDKCKGLPPDKLHEEADSLIAHIVKLVGNAAQQKLLPPSSQEQLLQSDIAQLERELKDLDEQIEKAKSSKQNYHLIERQAAPLRLKLDEKKAALNTLRERSKSS